ncbi:MAG: hydrogenase maturation protease [Gammaproteobacteria bacterium]
MSLKIIVLGNATAGDDGAAILAAKALQLESDNRVEIIFAGRPGTGLLDLLEGPEPVILMDVVSGSGEPGGIISISLDQLTEQLQPAAQTSSHGFGPTEVLSLGKVLGRQLPSGYLVGIEGQRFDPGEQLTAAVQQQLPEYIARVQALISMGGQAAPGP